ncbi:MAG TPA: MFS transporter [Ktedonobacteraceae bacterium]|nr:MFS transporter [Ktedonobacteraceae bacterium]
MQRRSAAPLLIGTFLLRTSSGAGPVVLGLLLAHLAQHQGHMITSLDVGLLSVVYYITELALATPMGALGDRLGRRYFLVLGPLLGLVQVALLIFTPTVSPLPYLLSLQVLAGISSAMMTPATLGYLADFTVGNSRYRVRVMSFYELVTSGGIAAGVVVGGFAWDRFDRYAFAVLALLYMLVAVCMLLVPKVQQVVEPAPPAVMFRRYWRILRTPRLFIFIPAWIAIFALVGIWFSSQLTFVLSMPAHNAQQVLMGLTSGPGGGRLLSLILGACVLFFGLCLLFWAFFLNRVPRIVLMLTSIAGIYLACIALGGINHRGAGNNLVLLLWIPLLMLGIFAETGFAPAALSYLADISEEAAKDRGLLMGLYSVFLGLGQLLGNGLGGLFARSWGFDGLIYLTLLLALVALISLLTLYGQGKRIARQKDEHERLPASYTA